MAVYLKIGEMELSHSEMFLAEPKTSAQALPTASLLSFENKGIKLDGFFEIIGTAQKMEKAAPSLIRRFICQRSFVTPHTA